MKLQYLDIHNRTALMPKLDRLVPIIRQFDEYLAQVNEDKDEKGLIQKLVKQNIRTRNKRSWERLYRYDADLSITIDLAKNKIQYEVKAYYKYPDLARTVEDQRVVAQF